MKEFSDISCAATCDSGVILESCSPESVVAKRRDSVQKPYGMTSAWGGRTANITKSFHFSSLFRPLYLSKTAFYTRFYTADTSGYTNRNLSKF